MSRVRPRSARKRTGRYALLAALLTLLGPIGLQTAQPASAADRLPVPYSMIGALAVGNPTPNSLPPGANDWSCKPSQVHPRPVVLAHGTLVNERVDWDSLAPLLHNHGYCVFTFNYGGDGIIQITQGLMPMEGSAVQLRDFVDRVLAATGTAQVDIVGHSQGGGPLPRYYMKFLGGAPKVHTLVGIGPTNHGGTVTGFATVLHYLAGLGFGVPQGALQAFCPACTEQFTGSAFLARLNSGGDTVPGVHYTVIASDWDEVAPPSADFLNGPNVTNIRLQNGCWFDFTGHAGLVFRPRVLKLVLSALDPAHPVHVPCLVEPFTL